MFWVYILLCEDDSLYTGFTDDIKHRVHVHYHGLKSAAKYTRSHKVAGIAALWKTASETGARKLEYRIKHLTKAKKLCAAYSLENSRANKLFKNAGFVVGEPNEDNNVLAVLDI